MKEIDYTRISTYLLCPRKYYWRMVRHLVPPIPNVAAEFGRCIHESLDVWYIEKDYKKAQEKFSSEWNEEMADGKRCEKTAHEMLKVYHDKYLDQPFEVLGVEESFSLLLPNNISYTGRRDKRVKWQGAEWIIDHKTTSMLSATFLQTIKPNTQFDGYVWSARKEGYNCVGVILDALLVAKGIANASWRNNHECVARNVSYRDEEDLKQFEDRVISVSTDIATLENLAESHEEWRQNTDACTKWNSLCPYRKLCLEKDPKVIHTIIGEYNVEPWEPNREKGGD